VLNSLIRRDEGGFRSPKKYFTFYCAVDRRM